MKADMTRQAEQYIRQVKNRRKLGGVVAALSVLVALITTYVLMLPGITMEHDVLCGLEAHTHTDVCYENRLVCGLEEGSTVGDVLKIIRLSPLKAKLLLMSVNGERASLSQKLKDGDVIGFIAPVSGG